MATLYASITVMFGRLLLLQLVVKEKKTPTGFFSLTLNACLDE